MAHCLGVLAVVPCPHPVGMAAGPVRRIKPRTSLDLSIDRRTAGAGCLRLSVSLLFQLRLAAQPVRARGCREDVPRAHPEVRERAPAAANAAKGRSSGDR